MTVTITKNKAPLKRNFQAAETFPLPERREIVAHDTLDPNGPPKTTAPPKITFNHKATEKKKKTADSGVQIDQNGDISWGSNGSQQDMSDLIEDFFRMIYMLLDPENRDFQFMKIDARNEAEAKRAKFEANDPAYIAVRGAQEKIRNSKVYKDTKSGANDKKTLKDIQTEYGAEMKDLHPSMQKLFTLLFSKESNGGKWNIVNDYTNRTKGFYPGDTTPGGLAVPTFTEMTVREVLDWQKQYLNEQKAANVQRVADGLKPRVITTATGGFQFIYTTLDEMVDDGLVNENSAFNPKTQINLAIARMITMRGLNEFLKGDITVQDMKEDMIREWQGLGLGNAPEQLTAILQEMKQEMSPLPRPQT